MEILGDFTTSVEKALGEIDPAYRSYDALVICGSHTPKKELIPIFLAKIAYARAEKKPFLGICFGHQLAAIEYARNILGITDATSEEFGEGTFVIKKRLEFEVGYRDGESYWSNYDVAIDWEKPEHFITTPFHPEYQSSIDRPHPLLVQFLNLCKKQ